MDASFRLKQVAGGLLRLAEVAVRVERAERAEVIVSEAVFTWRREVYSPNARWGGPDDELLIAGAIEGVQYVLDRLDGCDNYQVTVTKIVDAPADSTFRDVKFAAVRATCDALGVALSRPPFIDRTGAVFPD